MAAPIRLWWCVHVVQFLCVKYSFFLMVVVIEACGYQAVAERVVTQLASGVMTGQISASAADVQQLAMRLAQAELLASSLDASEENLQSVYSEVCRLVGVASPTGSQTRGGVVTDSDAEELSVLMHKSLTFFFI
jgi:hypothetical protein